MFRFPFHFLPFLLTPLILGAQIDEQFNQDLSNWQGDLQDFRINDQEQLQLNAAEGGSSILYRTTTIPDSCTWEIDIQLNFAPSGSNNVRCFLQADDTLNPSGYAIEWGASGDEDAITFVRYDSGSGTVLGQLDMGAVAEDPSIARLSVQKNSTTFIIRAAYDFGSILSDSVIIQDDQYPAGPDQLFLIECFYTSTRTDRFIFDNIFVGRKQADRIPPRLIDSSWILDTLLLSFNESVNLNFTEVEWVQDPGVDIFIRPGKLPNQAKIFFEQTLNFGTEYTVLITGLEDLSGNRSEELELSFLYDPIAGPAPFDILISEVMAAPSDQTALPNVEYVELVNRADRRIQLTGLRFSDGSRTAILPNFILDPGGFVLLCATSDTAALNAFEPVLGLPSFPGLNNGGDQLSLRLANGSLIHGITYTDDWYQDPSKDDGGWALELIDTSYACLGAEAYRASNDQRGGSPASANMHQISPAPYPQITEIEILSDQQCLVQFDQWIAPETQQPMPLFNIQPQLPIDLVRIPNEQPNRIELIFSSPLEKGIIYELELTEDFRTCTEKSDPSEISNQLGIPNEADSADLKISEIMFDPESGGAQWVEIHNPTEQVFSWKDLYLSFRAPDISDQVPIQGEDLILPGRYYVLTEDPTYLKNTFEAPHPNQIRMQDLPTIDRNQGNLRIERISTTSAQIIEEVCYNEDWHSGFVRDPKGVSLERMNMEIEACSANNWQSAAATVGYGTPTGVNSQALRKDTSAAESAFRILSPSFSPDGDGFEDQMVFLYTNPDGEEPPQLDLFVYSLNGIEVKALANNLSLGANTQILWDGTNENGLKMAEAYYLIKARTYNDRGAVTNWQATVYLIYPN